MRHDRQSIVIERLNADAARFRFKSEVMAHVRSVEQTYWDLARAHAALWAADKAVSLAQNVVEKIEDESPICARAEELAQASGRLQELEQRLVERTSDVQAAERSLRFILGLPERDNRRIIPVTPPTEARLEPDWTACLDAMMREQPDITQQKLLTRLAELELLLARHRGGPPVTLTTLYQMNAIGEMLDTPEEILMSTLLGCFGMDVGSPKKPRKRLESKNRQIGLRCGRCPRSCSANQTGAPPLPQNARAPLANCRAAQYKLLRSRAFLKQVIHQSTHTLARGFLLVDSSYKNYATADRMRRAAEERLQTQRAQWDEGQVTTDSLLDAIEQYASAVAERHTHLAEYNTAIAFLSECKGTLLEEDHIIVVEPTRRAAAKQAAAKIQDDQTRKASFAPG